jgi:Fic family protein
LRFTSPKVDILGLSAQQQRILMPRIRVPKPFLDLIREVKPETFSLMGKYQITNSQGKYLHWDEFKWRVEKGDEEVAAWTATKLLRQGIAKNLVTLQAEGDRHFSYCVPNSLSAKLHSIDRMTGGGRKISDGLSMSTDDKNRYLVKSLMFEEAITSAQLEGASTTREIAKDMLQKGLQPKDKSQQMILNNYLLMKKALEQKDEDLSIEFILELHEIATRQAIENNAIVGELRQHNNIVITNSYDENPFYPPATDTLIARLNHLCDFANTDHSDRDPNNFIHPIVKAIILHFMIGYIHPFGNGNGRTARAIFYWSIIKSGYWLFEYVSISKLIQEKRGNYDKSFIYTETDDFDVTYFIYNQVETISKAVQLLNEYVDKKQKDYYEFMNWASKSTISKKLNREQLETLKEAVRSPGREFTAKQMSDDFGITSNTARNYLNKLVDLDLLVQSTKKIGKAIVYLAPANLKSKLNKS